MFGVWGGGIAGTALEQGIAATGGERKCGSSRFLMVSSPSQRRGGQICDSISSSVLCRNIKRGQERRGRGGGGEGVQPGRREFLERREENF